MTRNCGDLQEQGCGMFGAEVSSWRLLMISSAWAREVLVAGTLFLGHETMNTRRLPLFLLQGNIFSAIQVFPSHSPFFELIRFVYEPVNFVRGPDVLYFEPYFLKFLPDPLHAQNLYICPSFL